MIASILSKIFERLQLHVKFSLCCTVESFQTPTDTAAQNPKIQRDICNDRWYFIGMAASRQCQRAPQVISLLITGRMPRGGKLPIFFLLRGRKSAFSPRRVHSLHRFVKFSTVQGHMGPLCRAKFHFNRCTGPIKSKVPLLVNILPAGTNPLTDLYKYWGFYAPNYPA